MKDIDKYLLNFIKERDFKRNITGATKSIKIENESMQINAQLHLQDNGNCKLNIPDNQNHTKVSDEIIKFLKINDILSFTNDKQEIKASYLNAAFIKTGYVLLFAKIGYPLLFWERYNLFRKQILNPEKLIFPLIFVCVPCILEDGVYYQDDCGTKGFIVVFKLVNPDTNYVHKIALLSPSPQTDFEIAQFILKSQLINRQVAVRPLKEYDFLNNPSPIPQLTEWAHGKSLNIHN